MRLLHPVFNEKQARHIYRLHLALNILDERLLKNSEELKTGKLGPQTMRAIAKLKRNLALPADDKLDRQTIERLNLALIDKTLTSRTQVAKFHKRLKRALRIVKIEADISADLSRGTIGQETMKAVNLLQKKYKLQASRNIDPAVWEKIESINASRPAAMQPHRVKPTQLLNKVRHPLRLNKKSSRVADLQRALAWLKYDIDRQEVTDKRYGRTTRRAVITFQQTNNLPITGNVGWKTKNRINELIESNRRMVPCQEKYRVRGTVRDRAWQTVARARIQIWEVRFKKEVLLTERSTLANGFYDVQYLPPKDPVSGKPKQPFQLQIRWMSKDGTEVLEKSFHVFSKVLWANFTLGDAPYRGISFFESVRGVIARKIGDCPIHALSESDTVRDISYLRRETGIASDDLIKLVLAHKCEVQANDPILEAQVFYAFLHQNMPNSLPANLYPDTPAQWDSWSSTTVEAIIDGIAFLDSAIATDVLQSALDQNFIPRTSHDRLHEFLAALERLKISHVLERPILQGGGTVTSLLKLGGCSMANYSIIAKHFARTRQFNTAFWNNLGKDPAISPKEIEKLRTIAALGYIAQNHTQTISSLQKQLKNGPGRGYTLSALHDFAALSPVQWGTVISDNGNIIPDWVEGTDETERRRNFIKSLENRTGEIYPTIWAVAGAGRCVNHRLGDMSRILLAAKAAPEFRIDRDPVQKLSEISGVQLSENEISALRVLQRIFRLGQTPEITNALLANGLYSSAQIHRLGSNRLRKILVAGGITADETARVYKRAECQLTTTMACLAKFRYQLQLHPDCIPSYKCTTEETEDLKKQVPDIETLFGPIELREVLHCDSVLGPSAYLVDVFRFLDEKESLVADKSAKDFLFARRPDLGNIKLNCQNTNTPMPYIDLVCEILENHVSGGSGNINFQSTWSSEELRAEPEHIEPQAYHTIKLAKFPVYGSFNLWQEETRVFLRHLNLPWHELMEIFKGDATQIAGEYFAISSQELSIIVIRQPTASAQQEFWSNDILGTAIPVALFLRKSGLSYIELLSLLNCDFINASPPKAVIVTAADVVDPDHQRLEGLTVARLDLTNRFLRLWRKIPYTMWELDLLLMHSHIGHQEINPHFLVSLMHFARLQKRLRLDMEELHAFYSDINTGIRFTTSDFTTQAKNLFQRLFLTGSIDATTRTDFAYLLDNVTTGKDLAKFKEPVMACLAIEGEDFDLLKPRTDQKLSLSALSVLYRYSTLAQAMRLTIKDLLFLLKLSGIANPFASMETTESVLDLWDRIKQAKTSLLQLEYVLTSAPDSSVGLRVDAYTQKIRMLRESIAGLMAKIGEAEAGGEDSLEMLLKMLRPFEEQQIRDTVFAILGGTWSASQAEVTAFITQYFSEIIHDLEAALSALAYTGPVSGENLTERRGFLQNELVNYLVFTTLKELVAVSFGLEPQQADLLLHNLTLTGHSAPLIVTLQSSALFAKAADETYINAISEATLPEIYRAMRLLHKAAILVQSLHMDISDLQWFLSNFNAVQTIDFSRLPIDDSQPPLSIPAWDKLYRLLTVKSGFPSPETTSFFAVLDFVATPTATVDQLKEQICQLTGWESTELAGLDLNGINFTQPESWEWLHTCVQYRRTAGVDFSLLYDLAKREQQSLEQTNASAVKNIVKAKYRNKQWMKVFEPVMNTLREKKRDALVAWLNEKSQRDHSPTIISGGQVQSNPEYWYDANDLFGWFCIDVEMCSDQLTSRIKQAISSCQLFINRCFLGLERQVRVALPDPNIGNSWQQWKWMKNYRIWEANRKVFLYPENWIEPELRHDKSQFFKEFETDLMASDLTNESAEAALQRYVQKLDEVANLKVASIYHQRDAGINTLHVVAHTHDNPPQYFYRTFDLIYSKWSGWQKIEAQVESEHAVPFIYNRKLYLFWIVFQEKPIKLYKLPPFNTTEEKQDSEEPLIMMEIQLAWSTCTKDGWQAATISKKKLIHPWQRPTFSYNLKPRYNAYDNTLMVELYISTSKEFNDHLFSHPLEKNKIHLSNNSWNETYKPWHSSTFVFDGKVRDINLYGLAGYYYMPESAVKDERKLTNSYSFVSENFGQDGAEIKRLATNSPPLALPSGMHYHYTRLRNNLHNNSNICKFNVFDSSRKSLTMLQQAQPPFEAVLCQQGLTPVDKKIRPLFYQDGIRSFFIKQDLTFTEWLTHMIDGEGDENIYSMYPSYHPWSALFQQEINRKGFIGLFDRRLQLTPEQFVGRTMINCKTAYQPITAINTKAVEQEDVDFMRAGPYAMYNWELFFHIPLLVANRLQQNQRFEEAMNWYHYIFDPHNTQNYEIPQRYWVTKPFFATGAEGYRKQRIQHIIEHINDFKATLIEWRNNPFRPHVVAEQRTVAYQKTVVMKYIENMIAWGDQLFRRDTMESINEALLLYVMVSDLLGDHPQLIPALNIDNRTFTELEAESAIDEFGNFRVEVALENLIGLPIEFAENDSGSGEPIPDLDSLYFGIPHNDKLLTLWDTVADRLFKIRHSMNIKGIKRELALFEPPIDPALLVKAVAAGIDPAGLLDQISAPSPIYRFQVVSAKALEFCREVSLLGDKLLDALEKQDHEHISVLRASNEVKVLENMKRATRAKIEEAQTEISAFEKLSEINQARLDHMASLDVQLEEEKEAGTWGDFVSAAGIGEKVCLGLAKVATWIPQFNVGANGAGGTPEATTEAGGNQVEKFFTNAAKGFDAVAKGLRYFQERLEKQAKAKRAAAEKEMVRRVEQLQKDHYDKMIAISQIRLFMAEQEYDSLEKKIELRNGEKEFLETKYTSEQLYQWMISQISSIYFQAYQLAYDMAKRAEKSYQRETGNASATFIDFGYWDSLKKGLLSADRLSSDIRRMQSVFLEENVREMEITKHLSLAALAPEKLLELRLTGRCFLDIEEWMYNLDYPGHYRRRIKSFSVSVDCSASEYTNINCSLTLLGSEIRNSSLVGSVGYDKTGEDSRFTTFTGRGESIATSHCVDDAGLFTLSFDDQRFLPFEGDGAISLWDIQLPIADNQFDFGRIADVILHISYTARDGGEILAAPARTALAARLGGSKTLLVALQYSFPKEWDDFLTPSVAGAEQVMAFSMTKEIYPFLDRKRAINITRIGLVIQGRYSGDYHVALSLPGGEVSDAISRDTQYPGIHSKEDMFIGNASPTGNFRLKIRRSSAAPDDFAALPPDDLDAVYFLVDYQ